MHRCLWNTWKPILRDLIFLHFFIAQARTEISDPEGPKLILEPASHVDFSNNSGVLLDCQATGMPSPSIEWLQADLSPVTFVGQLRQVLPNGTLMLSPFKAEDYAQDIHATTYKCKASNSVGLVLGRDVRVRAVVVQPYEAQVYDEFVIAGNTAVMKCQIPSFIVDYVIVTSWLRDSSFNIYSSSDGKYLILPSGELQISDVRATDGFSSYRCRTVHRLSGEKRLSATAGRLFVTDPHGTVPPRITEPKMTMSVKQGDDAILPCSSQAFPLPSYSWFVKGPDDRTIPILERDGKLIVKESNLLVKNIDIEDGRTYVCLVQNPVGSERVEVLLEVTAPLSAIVEPKTLHVDIGQHASLHCIVGGHPVTSLIWLKDGQVLESSQMASVRYDVLHINVITMRHRGMYQCAVGNEFDSAQASAEIKLGNIPPTILRMSEEEVIQPGQNVALYCLVSGSPAPAVQWTLDNQQLSSSTKYRKSELRSDDGNLLSFLNISDIRTDEGGSYSCRATNKVGLDVKSTRLNVYGRPYIRPMGKKSVVAGKSLFIHCAYSGYPIDSITWEKGGVRLPVSHLQVVFPNGTLKLLSVQRAEDAGTYACHVRNKQGQIARREVEILVLVPPRINPTSFQDTQLHEGAQARVICAVVEGDLPIAFTWLKDGRAIASRLMGVAIRQFDEFSSVLTVSKAAHEHSGNYTCLATNAAAADSYTAQITVNVPPQIIPFSFQGEFLVEGTLARVSCVASQGDLPLSLTWTKDGSGLIPEVGVTVREFDEHSSVLTIHRVTSQHNGNYTCHARNPAGSINHTAQLTVKVPPKWTLEPVDVVALPGLSVVIDCQAVGFPIPRIEWLKAVENSPGEYEALDYSDHSLMKLENGSLMLTNVRHDQGGHYLCHVTNGVGNGLSKVISLEVRAPVRLGEKVRNQTAVRGKEAKLRCFAQGDRPIRINWFRKQKKIALTSDDRMKIEHTPLENGLLSEITIKHSAEEDSSSYICAAENDFGKDEIVIHVVVIGSPEVPRELKIKDFLSRSVKISWTMPHDGNSPIKDFLVILAEENTKRQIQNVSTPGTTNEVIIADLKPATTYQAKVLAANEAGVSEASDVISFTTMEEAPQGPPDNVKAEPTGNNAIKVTWKPPTKELRNGHIRGYNVGYKVHESLDPHSFLTVEALETDKQEMSIVLEDLRPFTQYNIVVQAFNQIGTGPQSNPVMVLTSEDVPRHPPRNLRCTPLSSQSLQLMWDVLPSSAANGILQGYKVVYQREDEWYEQEIHEIKVTVGLGTVISGLQKFSNYSVQVLAYTRVGDGMRSDAVICSTVEDVPEAPAHVKALANSIGSVIVSWSPPRRPNGILISYTVYMRSLDLGRKDIIKRSVSASETYHELSRLKINTRYEFWVTASTSLGEGQSTAVIAFSTAEGPLVAAKVVSFGESVIAAWQTSIKLPCIAVGIPPPEREWKFTGSIEKRDWTDVLTDGTLHLTNLQTSDGGNYTCRVSNSYGSDTISYTIAVQVPPTAPSLTVSSSTYTSMEVRWERKNDKIVIKGYYLYYKRDFGEWEEIYLGREHNRYLLSQLECGTRYQIYLAAFNKLGVGAPGDIILTKTKGSVPIQPPKHKFIQEEQTFVILLLEKWSSGGCPVLYFVVEYKPITKDKWKLVSNNVLLEQREFVIPDLPSASWFALRVTAHNNAGSTVAKYLFSTLNTDGGTIAPLANMDHSLVSVPTMQDLRIVIPLIIGLASIITICFLSWMFCKRKRMHHQLNNAHSFTKEQDPRFPVKAVYEKNSSAGSFTYLLDSNQKNLLKEIPPLFSNKPNKDNLSPYATSQISAAQNKEMTTFGQRKAPHVYPLIEEDKFNEVQRLDPRMKKQSQQLQVTGEPDTMYIHEYNRPVSGEYSSHGEMQPNLHVWNLRPGTQGYYDQHVPDLLDHHPDSSTSNSPDVASSPDLQSMRNTEEVESPTERRKRIKETRYPSLKYGQRSKETTYIFDNADNKEEGYEEEDISDGEYDRAHYDHEMSHQSPSKPVLSSKIHRNIRNIYDENTSVV